MSSNSFFPNTNPLCYRETMRGQRQFSITLDLILFIMLHKEMGERVISISLNPFEVVPNPSLLICVCQDIV